MGKQSRRKQRQRRGNKNNNKTAPPKNDDTTVSNSPFANVVTRIRHADPKVRLASLLGLQSTLTHDWNSLVKSNSSSSSTTNKKMNQHPKRVSLEIVQAVREQVMDNYSKHLECAIAATECLVQYLKINHEILSLEEQHKDDKKSSDPTTTLTTTTTASWSLLFLGRLEQCHKELQNLLQNQKQQQPHDDKGMLTKHQHIKEARKWCALAVPCLQALCHLVETNPLTLNQIMTTPTSSTKEMDSSFLSTLLGLVEDIMMYKDSNSGNSLVAAAHETKTCNNEEKDDNDYNNDEILMDQTAVYACRVLHSSLDDNEDLLHQLAIRMGTMTSPATADSFDTFVGWSTALSTPTLPVMAQLHLAGSLTTALANGGRRDDDVGKYWREQVLQYAIPFLLQQLQKGTEQHQPLQQIYASYQQAKVVAEQEEEDDTLERDVIRKIQARREPAREIARRQKQQPRPIDHPPTATTGRNSTLGDDDMEMMDVEEGVADLAPPTIKDGPQAMEEAINQWNAIMDPFELSLEVTANLLSCLIRPSLHEDEDMENEMMEQADDQHYEPMQQRLMNAQLSQWFMKLLQHVSELKFALVPKTRKSLNDETQASSDDQIKDDTLLGDLDNILSKVSACIVNCFLSHCITFKSKMSSSLSVAMEEQPERIDGTRVFDPIAFWQGLKRYLHAEDVSSVMVVAVRHNAVIRRHVVSSEVDSLLGELIPQTSFQAKIDHRQAKIQRDVVCLLSAAITLEEGSSNAEVLAAAIPNDQSFDGAVVVTKVTSSMLRLLDHVTTFVSSTSVDNRPDNKEIDFAAPVAVACEVLNALMDIFAQDDLYDDIFHSLDVLMQFEKGVVRVRQIRQKFQRHFGRESFATIMDHDEQDDIVCNAEQFVQYKKQQGRIR